MKEEDDIIEDLKADALLALEEAKKLMAKEDDDKDDDKDDDDKDLEEGKDEDEEDEEDLEEGKYMKTPADDYDLEMDNLTRDKKIIAKLDKKAINALLKYYSQEDVAMRLSAYGSGPTYKGYMSAFAKRAQALGITEGLDKVGDEDDDIDNDGDSDKSDEYLKKRRDAIASKKNESVDFVADMTSLAEADESLSEEFKEKAGTLFEVALTTRLREETEKLQLEFEDRLNEETEKIRDSLEEKVDNYLTYAVESWVEDNKIAIEGGLRTEVAESFIDALKNVFVEHYIEVPESKKDIVADLETKLVVAEEALSATGKQAEELSEQVEILVREKILAEAAESLADTQGARLQALAQDIEFVNEETFRKKVLTIKECYFKGKAEVIEEVVTASYQTTEVIVEESDASDLSPTMQNYVKTLGRINKASNLSGR